MDWILQYILWVSLMSSSAYKCKQHSGFYDYPHYHEDSEEDTQVRRYEHPAFYGFDNFRPPQIRRSDHANYETQHEMNERSAERTNRPTQRMNERSIAVNSGIQRVQEQERKRLQARIEDPIPRTENGSYKIVNNFPEVYPSVASRRGQVDEDTPNYRDTVVFPGPTRKSTTDLVPEVPNDCMTIGICESVPNYPRELADRIIAQLGEKRHRFHIDELEPEIAQRIGPAEENVELCNFREQIITPEAARDKNDNWYFILNQKDNPLQGYRVEICNRDGSACNPDVASFHRGYTASCKQKHVQRHMTVIDRDGKVKDNVAITVPSCCSCVASYTGRK